MKTALARATPEIRFEERDQSDKLAEVEAQAIANAYYINKFQQMESSLDEEYEEGFRAWLMGQSAFTANLKAKGAGACDVDGKNLTRKKRLETLGPMNLEDAYYYYKYIINGEEFKPTSIYARENKKPEELIGGRYDPDYANRNTRQPFAQAEPPSSSDSEGRAGREPPARRAQGEATAKKRMDKESTSRPAASRRAIKAGKGAREALIQKALPSKEPRDEMIESDDEGGLRRRRATSAASAASAARAEDAPAGAAARPLAAPGHGGQAAGPSRPPEVVAAEAVAVAAARAVLEQVPVAVQAQLANAGIEIAPSSPHEKEAMDKRRAAYKDMGRRPGYATMDVNDALELAAKKVKEATEARRAGLLKKLRSGAPGNPASPDDPMDEETEAERAANRARREGFLVSVSPEIARAAGDAAVAKYLAEEIDYNQLASIAHAQAAGVNKAQARIAEQHRDISDLGGDVVKFFEAEREADPLGSAAKGPLWSVCGA
eukprot:tig00000342_g24266.t1